MSRLLFFALALLLPILGRAEKMWSYAEAVKAGYNPKDYDWNALNTRWINMRAIALLGIDGVRFDQSAANIRQVGDMGRYERADVRGLRLGFGGSINLRRPWSYLFSISINSVTRDYDPDRDDAVTILDAMVNMPLWGANGRMQIGKMKEPISMERSMGLVFEQVMERPMHVDAFTPTRNIGVTLSDMLLDGRMSWRAGVFNDWLDSHRPGFSDNNRQYVGRITGVLYDDPLYYRLLHLGVGYRYEDVRRGSVRYKAKPEYHFCTPWIDTGDIPAKRTQLINTELTWLSGAWWLAAEYSRMAVDAVGRPDPVFDGWDVTLNWFATGEHRGYDYRRGIVKRVKPLHPVDHGGWGALEFSARYSTLDLNSRGVEGGRMDVWSLGTIWHPLFQVQLHLQYSHARPESHPIDDPTAPTMKSSANLWMLRVVFLLD